MLRRSPRLSLNGYYFPRRQVLYREIPFRDIRRREPRICRSISEIIVHHNERQEGSPSFEQTIAEFIPPPTEGPHLVSPVQTDHHNPRGAIPVVPLLPNDHPVPPYFFRCGALIYILYIFLLMSFIFVLLSNALSFHRTTSKSNPSIKSLMRTKAVQPEELENVCSALQRTDKNKMVDYALQSLGATVKTSSQTYRPIFCKWSHFPIWCKVPGPETVLQPEIFPGKCWGFKGSQGHLVISLPHPVRITHVTLEHLPKNFSSPDHMESMPKDFAVYGLGNEKGIGKQLGKFTYDLNREYIQTFEIPDSPSEMYPLVALIILSNWGHPEYTCVYRFRVHSQPRHIKEKNYEIKQKTINSNE